MKELSFGIPEYTTAEEIKRIRKNLGYTQKEFAKLVNTSKPTVERWERSEEKITGPIVPLLLMLQQYPDFSLKMEIPEKRLPLRLKYMYKDRLCTIIDVDESKHMVEIKNYTDELIYRAFGINEKPTFEDYEEFLEERCFPRTRDKMKLILENMGLPFYDPFLIVEKTQGRMAEDDFWIEIVR